MMKLNSTIALIFFKILLLHEKPYNYLLIRIKKQSSMMRCLCTDNLLSVRLKQMEISLCVCVYDFNTDLSVVI